METLKLFDLVQKIDEIINSKEIDDSIPELKKLLSNEILCQYFFERIDDEKWLQPLNENGFFECPAQVKKDEMKRSVEFPSWPQSKYLSKMASLNPEEVSEIMIKIPNTDNVRIIYDFIDAMLQMPPTLLEKLLERAKKWAQSKYQLGLPRKLGALISHLSKGGQVEAALELTRHHSQKPVLTHGTMKRFLKKIFQNYFRPPD